LKEACYSDFAERLLIVDYDLLSERAPEVFALLHQFLGEEPFTHDFEAVTYDAPTFDAQLGIVGLHSVYPKVEARPRQTILPPDLFQRYSQLAFWRDLPKSGAHRIVPTSSAEVQVTAMPTDTAGPIAQD
jgi:sulfotransferase